MATGSATSSPCECSGRTADLTVSIRAEKAAIAPAVLQLVNFAAEHMPDNEQKILEIDLALQEAVANAVVHGCGEDSRLQVSCWASYAKGKGLLLVVRDPGPGFIPSEVPDPIQEANLKFDHGRGVFLINSLMDEVHFRNNGSEIHMIKY
ncbi:MAG TPA: ATP-binding protein [Terriglobales bacterium]|nr:ATP-binding protein [Terriglobales bacterium]